MIVMTIAKTYMLLQVNYAVETWLNLTKPFWGDFMAKIDVYGTEIAVWKPKLLKNIDASQLPPKFGGAEGWVVVSPRTL